ncbi:MAG: CPBP family intramembrane metalloprotease [Pseudomonadota bacterium]|nr:CPBP family intramembrane metalloprotease [Pseudomonadota bacterium]
MRTGTASGIQIAFLSFAVLLLAVPLSAYVAEFLGSSNQYKTFIGRFLPFLLGAAILAAFPGLRLRVIDLLSLPIPRERRFELALVALGGVSLALAMAGALALWYWLTEGNAALEQHMKSVPADEQMAQALSGPGLLTSILLAVIVGPILEEILFRGFLYTAWERRWGWLPGMVLSSILFALYHPHFWAAFTSSVVYTCVFRRTGSLWGSTVAHSFVNLMLWYPLLGQFVFPDAERAIGDIHTWGLQLACLLFVVVALPLYVWLSRKPYADPLAEPV